MTPLFSRAQANGIAQDVCGEPRGHMGLAVAVLLLVLSGGGVQAQPSSSTETATLRGFVRAAANGQPLRGANVVVRRLTGARQGAGATDEEGFYQVSGVRAGRHVLRISYVGFRPYRDTLRLQAGERRTLSVRLSVAARQLGEVTVEERARLQGEEAGLRRVRAADIAAIPTPGPGSDLAAYLRAQPEVTATGDRGGRLYIRGGTPSQNLVLVDGTPIYKPFHIVGFYSAFPGNLVASTDFYAGGFSAEHTGRISSVMDVQLRSGNTGEVQGQGGVGPFLASARVEGPLQKGRKSFLVNVRHSLIEEAGPSLLGEETPYRFYDVTAKLHTQSASSQCSVTGVRTYDRGRIDPDGAASFQWSNTSVGGECLLFGQASAQTFHVAFGATHFGNEVRSTDQTRRASDTWKARTKFDLTQPAPWEGTVQWGGTIQADQYSYALNEPFLGFTSEDRFLLSASLYGKTTWEVTEALTVTPSIGGQSLFAWDGVSVDPRVRLAYQPGSQNDRTLTAAVGVYHQIPTTIADERDVGSTFRAWTPTPFLNKPLRADHALLGWAQPLAPGLRASVEGWYKRFQDLPVPRWTPLVRTNTTLARADGRAYGADVRLRYTRDPVRLSLSYGYGRVTYEAAGDALGAWTGEDLVEYNPPHDRRHKLSARATWQGDLLSASVRWQYGSGLPFTQVYGYDTLLEIRGRRDAPTDVVGRPRTLYRRPYRDRLPAYHRLDLSAKRTLSLGPALDLTVEGGAINAYNRANLFYIDIFTLDRVDQLPLIPYLSLQVDVR